MSVMHVRKVQIENDFGLRYSPLLQPNCVNCVYEGCEQPPRSPFAQLIPRPLFFLLFLSLNVNCLVNLFYQIQENGNGLVFIGKECRINDQQRSQTRI